MDTEHVHARCGMLVARTCRRFPILNFTCEINVNSLPEIHTCTSTLQPNTSLNIHAGSTGAGAL
jgi:hypothetical protein